MKSHETKSKNCNGKTRNVIIKTIWLISGLNATVLYILFRQKIKTEKTKEINSNILSRYCSVCIRIVLTVKSDLSAVLSNNKNKWKKKKN